MFYIIAIILLLILLFPIKVKTSIQYKDGLIKVFVLNKELNLKKKVATHKASVENAAEAHFKLANFLPNNIKKMLYKLSKSKFKVGAHLDIELNYGFEDAALTGIFYGLLHGLSSVIYAQFYTLVKIKKYTFNVLPHFNEPMLNFRANCIISFNLAKVIYMLISYYVF